MGAHPKSSSLSLSPNVAGKKSKGGSSTRLDDVALARQYICMRVRSSCDGWIFSLQSDGRTCSFFLSLFYMRKKERSNMACLPSVQYLTVVEEPDRERRSVGRPAKRSSFLPFLWKRRRRRRTRRRTNDCAELGGPQSNGSASANEAQGETERTKGNGRKERERKTRHWSGLRSTVGNVRNVVAVPSSNGGGRRRVAVLLAWGNKTTTPKSRRLALC